MPLHRYYRHLPAVQVEESRFSAPRDAIAGPHGFLRDAEALRDAWLSSPEAEVRAYLFGRLAAAHEIRFAKKLDGESFHPLERDWAFWRGLLDAAGRFAFLRSKSGYEYPQVVLQAAPFVLRSLLDLLADEALDRDPRRRRELNEATWSDEKAAYLLQSLDARLDVRGEHARALLEHTHGGLDATIEDPDNAAIVRRILVWRDDEARRAAVSDDLAVLVGAQK